MNEQNLKNLRARPKEERQAIASLGGKARQEQLRKLKQERKSKGLEDVLSETITNNDIHKIARAMIKQAKLGNLSALNLIFKLIKKKRETATTA